MFKPSLNVEKSNDDAKDIKNKRIEGIRISQIALVDGHQTDKEAFS